MSDWTRQHAEDALRMLGGHTNAATAAIVTCPQHHELFRVVMTEPGPVYLARATSPRLPVETKRELGERAARTHDVHISLHTAAYVAGMEAAGIVDRWPASCDCGSWSVPHTYVLDIADEPPRRVKGVPRIVADPSRVSRE